MSFKVGDYVTCIRQGIFEVREVQPRWHNDTCLEVNGRVPFFLDKPTKGNKRKYATLLMLQLIYDYKYDLKKDETWISMDEGHCNLATETLSLHIEKLKTILKKLTHGYTH